MNIFNKTRWLSLGALIVAMPAAADPRESRADDPSCARGGSPAVLVHVAGLKNGAGKVRVQAYGPGAANYLKKGEWAGRVDVPLGGRRSLDTAQAGQVAGDRGQEPSLQPRTALHRIPLRHCDFPGFDPRLLTNQ